jgi:hypothetical protein
MAVQSDISSISYTGNNSTSTSYAVPFVFQENSHLAATAKVTATGVENAVTLANHTGAGDVNGGTVTTSVAVPATSTLTIYRTVPVTQTTSYAEGGDFPAASHERALDKLTQIAQQNRRAISSTFRVTEGSGAKNELVAVANTLIGLDANNQPKAMTISEVKTFLALSGVTLSVSAGMKTFADAGERALAVPEFVGQLGTQRDTGIAYVATGSTAGSWTTLTAGVLLSSFASGFFTADATGRGKFGSGFVDTALIADSTSTTTGVTNAKLRQSSALSVIGRSANSSGAPADIAASSDGAVLRRSGTSIGFGTVGNTGLADNAVTVAKLGSTEQKQISKAWVRFDGAGASGSNATILASHNVASVAKTANAAFTVNFSSPMSDANYVVVGDHGGIGGLENYVFSTSSFSFETRNDSGGTVNNPPIVMLVVFGN